MCAALHISGPTAAPKKKSTTSNQLLFGKNPPLDVGRGEVIGSGLDARIVSSSPVDITDFGSYFVNIGLNVEEQMVEPPPPPKMKKAES